MLVLYLALIMPSVDAGMIKGLQLIEITTANMPVAFVSAKDGTGDMYIVERTGLIKRYADNEQFIFLDISEKVEDSFSDQGLLGLAFDPDFKNNGYFYVNYTRAGGQYEFGVTVIERYYFSFKDKMVDVDLSQVVLEVEQFYHNHNGGTMHFGEDGYLYLAMGDGGMRRDPMNFSQNLSELLGKMLRIDVNPDVIFKTNMSVTNKCGHIAEYYLPNDNPYINDTSKCGEIFFFGLRSPWKWSFDALNGDFYIGDVGQDSEEEVSFINASSMGGNNLGWSCKEGNTILLVDRCPEDLNDLTDPIISYFHNPDNSGNSVVGGYRYRGKSIAELWGQYMFADTVSGQVFLAELIDGTWVTDVWKEDEFLIVSFAEDDQGEIYTIHFSGEIKKLVKKL